MDACCWVWNSLLNIEDTSKASPQGPGQKTINAQAGRYKANGTTPRADLPAARLISLGA